MSSVAQYIAEVAGASVRLLATADAIPASVRPWVPLAAALLQGAADLLDAPDDNARRRAAMDTAERIAAEAERLKFGAT